MLKRIAYGTFSRGEPIPTKRFDIILHFAARSSTRQSIQYPYEVFKDNNDLTVQLLEKARRDNSIFVYPTSATADAPSNPYSLSKLQGAEWVKMYTQLYGMKAFILKLFNVYGESNKKGAVYLFCSAALRGEKATVYGDGSQISDYIHVEDVVTFLEQILNGKMNPGEYELGTGVPTTVNSLVKLIEQLSGRSILVESKNFVMHENIEMYSRKPAIGNPLPIEIGITRVLDYISQSNE